MYEDRFGFTGRPFQLTPDPAFWYETATHRKAMAYLGYGLAQGEGFIVVTGDIGAGKTTLMGHLLDTIDPQALNAIKLVSTAIEADDLLRIVATALGVEPAGLAKAQLLTAIERGLHGVARQGRRTLLLVDEAQALPVSALEELRMLSNFQLGGHALVQIVLMGQPEFRDRLNGTGHLEQLRQRVIAIHHLDPMGADEVAGYVGHRLAVVGWNGEPVFTDDAHAAFHRHSDGIPRRLNQLATRVLLQAGIEGVGRIDGALVRAVADDLRADLPAAQPTTHTPIVADPESVIEAAFREPGSELEPASASAPAPEPALASVPEPDAEPELVVPRWVPTADQTSHVSEPTPFPGSSIAIDDTIVDAPIIEPVTRHPSASPAEAAPQDYRAADPGLHARIAVLEERVEVQEAALRRVLTLLVDWVEGDVPRAGLSPLRDAAA